jgi:hypothetical protein
MTAHTRPLATPSNSAINHFMSVTSEPAAKRVEHPIRYLISGPAAFGSGSGFAGCHQSSMRCLRNARPIVLKS